MNLSERRRALRRYWLPRYEQGDDHPTSLVWSERLNPRMVDEYVDEIAETSLMRSQKLDRVFQEDS